MKERGIITNSEMVRAILDGRKTQTRRALTSKDYLKITKASGCGEFHPESLTDKDTQHFYCLHSPFGQIGDRLWVRETAGLQVRRDCLGGTGEFFVYKADKPNAVRYRTACGTDVPVKWQSPVRMKRCHSRITLEITDVRVERLQAASDDDFKAEGYPLERELTGGSTDAFCWFRHLWDSVSKPDCNYESNPWVWVIEFKRV
ncbi:hypothetical protein AHYW_001778 [Providencia manganoxydans]|uniref:hypothetical protein n=1 Tax=Providencia manganoxydans TaxID=2923283 RepID=UPI003DA1872B